MGLIYRLSAVLGAGFLVANAGLVAVQIVARWFGVFLPIGDEFAGYCLAASLFLALPYTFEVGGHIRVELVLGAVPARVRRALEAACLIIGAALTFYFAGYAAMFTWNSFRFGSLSMGLFATPLWIPQTGMAVGLAVLAIAHLDHLWRLWRGREGEAA